MINALTLFLLVLLLFSYCIHNNKMKCKRSNRRLLGTLFLAIPRISGFSASSAGDRVSTSLQVVNDKFVKQIEEDVARRERRREAIEQELLAIERKKEAARQRIQDLQAGLEADIVKLDKQASKLDSDLDTALQDIQTQLEKLSEAEAGEIGGEWWRLATQAAPPLGAATSVLAAIVAGRKVLENREDVWEQQRQEAEALKVRKALEQQQQPGEEMEQQKANMETKLKKEGGGNFISIVSSSCFFIFPGKLEESLRRRRRTV